MRRQPPLQTSRQPSTVTPTPVRVVHGDAGDRAVLLDRASDGAELEIGPISTTRGARWTRAEGLIGVGLVAVLFGGAIVNSIANPGPTPSPDANAIVSPATTECTPAADRSAPARARLRKVGDAGSGASGRTGQTTQGTAPAPEHWLLPRPVEGVEIGLGTPLEAVNGPTCVTGWSAWVVPTRDVLVNAEATMVLVGAATFAATASPFRVPGPTANGDWTLQLATAYKSESNATIWSVKFFRVVVGGAPFVTPVPPTPRPTPVPTPAVTPAVACGTLTAAGGPPVVSLVVPGQEPVAGTNGANTWFGSEVDISDIALPEGPTIPFEGALEFQIGGDLCATRWSIASMQFPQDQTTFSEGTFGSAADWAGFSVNRDDNPIIAQQNRIAATTVGLGRTIIRAVLYFEGGNVIQAYWLVRISGFPVPTIRVVGPDGASVTPVVTCGMSIQTNETWFGEECHQGSWPVLEDGPILVVHEGDVVTIESPDWPLQNWNIAWADQASVEDGGDPNVSGWLSGSTTLEPETAQWVAPPAGDWSLRFDLSRQDGERYYGLPLQIRLRVLP